jgi:hypothetical protein
MSRKCRWILLSAVRQSREIYMRGENSLSEFKAPATASVNSFSGESVLPTLSSV